MTLIDRATMARALTRALTRAPEMKRAPLAVGEVSATGLFEGYASLFGVADLGGDVVMAGAFRDSLRKRDADRVKMLWQHDPAEPIGAWLAIEEDARGLKVRGRLNLEVSRAREILALMRDGHVDGLSIGFRTLRAMQDRKTGLRHLQKLDLWEISLVTFPMLPQARVTAVKNASDPFAPAGADPRFAVRRGTISRDGARVVR
ncbi:MAG TPA: HK97 family phage prohead protease [Rhodoblastus sp.]|nr:HK97 family phage prohead protease [Rhodoblastus sp.]